MKRFAVWYRGRDGKTHRAAARDGSVTFGPGTLAAVKRSLHRRHLPFRVRKVKTRMTPGQRIVAEASKYIGVTESPAGSNDGPHIRGWLAYVGWTRPAPWCAAFALSMLRDAGYPLGIRSAYVPAIEAWARAHRQWVPVNMGPPKEGWLIVFEFNGDTVPDHIGIVRGRAPQAAFSERTIEGNTSSGDSGSQSNGGGVFPRSRAHAVLNGRPMIKGYVRTY